MILPDCTGPYLWSLHEYNLAWPYGTPTFIEYDLARPYGILPLKHTWVWSCLTLPSKYTLVWSCSTIQDPTFKIFISMILPDHTGPYLWSIYEYDLAQSYGTLTFEAYMSISLPDRTGPYLQSIHEYDLAQPYGTPTFVEYNLAQPYGTLLLKYTWVWSCSTLPLKDILVWSCSTVQDPTFKAFISMILPDRTGPYLQSIYEYDLAWSYKTPIFKAYMNMILPDLTEPLPLMSMILPDRTGPYLRNIHEYALARPYGTLPLKHSWVWSCLTLQDPYFWWVWSCPTARDPIFETYMSMLLPDRTGPFLWSIHEFDLARPYGTPTFDEYDLT